jgi:hypothetical protein
MKQEWRKNMRIKSLLLIILVVFTLSNLSAVLHKVAEKPLNFFSSWIELDGDLAFIGTDEMYHTNPVFLMDLSDPENPVIIEELMSFSQVQNIAIKDSVAFVSSAYGLKLINYRNLNDITISTYYGQSVVNDVRIFGNQAIYLTENGFTVLDVTEAATPQEIISFDTGYNLIQSDLRDNYLFLLADDGCKIFDVSNISDPQFCSEFIHDMYLPDSFAFNNNLMYIAAWGTFFEVDITDLQNPVLNGISYDFMIPRNITIQDNLLYFCSFILGYCCFDITDLENPILVETYQTPREAVHYASNDENLYLIDWSYGLQILEKDSSENPYEIARYFQEFHYAEDFDFDDDFIYVADMMHGLIIYERDNPDYPIYVSDNEWGLSISLIDDMIYLSYRTGTEMNVGIRSYDVSDPYEPVLINDLLEENYGTRVYDNYLVFENDIYNLDFYDLSNSGYPVFAGQVTNDYSITSFNISNDLLFMAVNDTYNNITGIQIYDIADLSNIEQVSFIDMPFEVFGLEVFEDVVYASFYNLGWYGSNSGYYLIDVSNASSPVNAGILEVYTMGSDRSVGFGSVYCELFGNDLVIADNRNNRIQTYDATDLLNPVLQDEFYWNFSTGKIEKDDSSILVNNWVNGITELNWEDFLGSEPDIVKPVSDVLYNYPNPFNPTTNISFSLNEPGEVDLTIYNMKGQQINVLAKDYLAAGDYKKSWHGIDNTGNKVSSGIYLIRLSIDGKLTDTKKCLLLK